MANEIILKQFEPLQVTPSGDYSIIQNAPKARLDTIFVSQDDAQDKRWLELGTGASVKFDAPIYIKQVTLKEATLPLFEG